MPEAMQIEQATPEETQPRSNGLLIALGAWSALATIGAVVFFILWMNSGSPAVQPAVPSAGGWADKWLPPWTPKQMPALWYAWAVETSHKATNLAADPTCATQIKKITEGLTDSQVCVMWASEGGKCTHSSAGSVSAAVLWALHRHPSATEAEKTTECKEMGKRRVIAWGGKHISFFDNEALMPFKFNLPEGLKIRIQAVAVDATCVNGVSSIDLDQVTTGLFFFQAALFDKGPVCPSVKSIADAEKKSPDMVQEAGRVLNHGGVEITKAKATWDDLRWDILFELVYQKFKNAKDHRADYIKMLLSTEDFILAEASYPGVGIFASEFGISIDFGKEDEQAPDKWPNRPFTNLQGAALMAVRARLKKEEHP